MPAKARYLFIQHGATLGGAGLALADILREIDSSKIEFTVWTPDEGPLTQLYRKLGAKTFIGSLPIDYRCSLANPSLTASIVDRLKERVRWSCHTISSTLAALRFVFFWHPDLVVLNSSTVWWLAIVFYWLRIPVVTHVREIYSTEKNAHGAKRFLKKVRKASGAIVATSKYSEEDLNQLSISEVKVIYDGAPNLERFVPLRNREIQREMLGFHPEEFVVGWVGQIYRAKGWDVLVKAAFELATEQIPIRFLVVGSSVMLSDGSIEGTEIQLFQQMVEELGLSERFLFVGQRSDVENFYPAMDAFAFTTKVSESFGKVVTEAMACGVPVIMSRTGAYREIIPDDSIGMTVEPDKPRELAKAIRKFAKDPELIRKMANQAVEHCRERFCLSGELQQLFRIYRNVQSSCTSA